MKTEQTLLTDVICTHVHSYSYMQTPLNLRILTYAWMWSKQQPVRRGRRREASTDLKTAGTGTRITLNTPGCYLGINLCKLLWSETSAGLVRLDTFALLNSARLVLVDGCWVCCPLLDNVADHLILFGLCNSIMSVGKQWVDKIHLPLLLPLHVRI